VTLTELLGVWTPLSGEDATPTGPEEDRPVARTAGVGAPTRVI
jgi:hypothetical protein